MTNKTDKQLTRRQFVHCAGLASLAWGLGSGCRGEEPAGRQTRRKPTASPGSIPADKWQQFPTIEARGTPFEIGAAVGSMNQRRIRTGIERRQTWFDDLKRFALADRATRIDGFVAAMGKHCPAVLAEIKGMAQGSGLPLDDLLVLNLQCELGALIAQGKKSEGCSTFQLAHSGRLLLAHNEDGHDAYQDLLTILRLSPEGRPGITALAYPGIVPGNVPAMTEAGLVLTTNFIGADQVVQAIPRYALGRSLLECGSLDEAIAKSTADQAAYSVHFNLGSTKEKRLVSVDVAVGRSAVQEIRGLNLQTNHFVLPETKEIPQTGMRPGGSSDSRYQVLSRAIARLPGLDLVGEKELVTLLASHEAATPPYSPCRHPNEKSSGRTLATALFDLISGRFTLYEGNPCLGRRRILVAGAQAA
jgi:hypothetical protein